MIGLQVLQSMWAMERRHPDNVERSVEENANLIADAGFDGISVHRMSNTDSC